MIDGTYELLINTPIGEKKATAVLLTQGEDLHVDVKVSGFPRQRGVGRVSGNAFTAEGEVKIPFVGSFDYQLDGSVKDDLMEAVCHTSKGDLLVAGLRKA